MQYQYTAANSEGKQLSGVINGNTEEEARKQLNTLGFSILKIEESKVADTEVKSDMEKYEFEAIDKTGKQIKGTIPAKTPILAYKRLADEYNFTIIYLAPKEAAPEEKMRMRQTGVQELQNQYDLEKNQKKVEDTGNPVADDPKFIMEKDTLIKEVDVMLQKVKTMLVQFETKISPEKRAEIEGIIDKLLRIKSSNNLDYIRNTSKELLKKIQEEEVFLKESQHDEERKTVLMQSQKMLLGLSKTAAAKIDISVKLQEAMGKWEKNLEGSKMEFLMHPLSGVKEKFALTPEMQSLRTQLSALRSQRWGAIKIALRSPKETRSAAWESVKEIRAQEKEVQIKIRQEKHLRHDSNLVIKREKHVYFLEEFSTFTGWLLFFYLLYYFVGHYVTTLGLSISPILGIPFDMADSALFKYLLAIVFLIHAAISLKLNFFLRSKAASMVLVPVTLVLSLLIVFNV
jgi:hypothetical protein